MPSRTAEAAAAAAAAVAILVTIHAIGGRPLTFTSGFSFSQSGHDDLVKEQLLLRLLRTPNITVDADHIDRATCGRCGNSRLARVADTLSTIAAYCDVPVNQTLAENPGLKLSNISNSLLNIPCSNSSTAQCGICGDSYTVKRMDTMETIASTCGMLLSKLEMENQDVDFNNIDGDQLLRVPCRNHTPALLHGCGACGSRYTVDSRKQLPLKDIARLCSSTVEELSAANPGFNFGAESLLVPGQQIDVPCHGDDSNSTCGPCGNSYIVRTGDYFDSVAAKCRVGFVELSNSNPGGHFSSLGTTLNIPCAAALKPTRSCLCNSTYVVTQNMSSVQEVASHCNVTPALVSYANGISPEAVLTSGQALSVPCQDTPPSELNTCSICGSSFKPTIMVNLVTVARLCNTTSEKIKSLNNLSSQLQSVGIGDSLLLPCEDHSAGCGPCGIAYKALRQDNLPSIAVKCATMPQRIEKVNQDLNFSKPFSGRLVNIPCRSSKSLCELLSYSESSCHRWEI